MSIQDTSAPSAGSPPEQPVPLFRPEVIASKLGANFGSIKLAQPISGWVISVVAAILSILLIMFAVAGTFHKKARVTGLTTPAGGTITISAQVAGTLQKILVHEGENIVEGMPMFEISTERQGMQGEISTLVSQQLAVREETLAVERRNRIEQASEKKRSLKLRLDNADQEMAQLVNELTLAQNRVQLSQATVKKFEALEAGGFVSSTQAQQKQEELLDVKSRVASLERAYIQAKASRQSIADDLVQVDTDLENMLAQISRTLASLKQEAAENMGRKTLVVTAPQNGTLTTLTHQPGQALSAGQVLATLLPATGKKSDDQLEVHLFAPSKTSGFIAPGQRVLLRYDAFPYQKFGLYGGTVTDVSKTPLAPNELPSNIASTILSNAQQNIPGFNSNESLYRIRVRIDAQALQVYGKPQSLKPGMTLEADILQDERKIWEWVLDPLLAVTRG